MTKLRSIAVVAVLGAALFASGAYAQEAGAAPVASAAPAAGGGGGGWDTKYGMIFTLQNVFDNGDKAEFGSLNGGVGLQYNLGPQSALRLMVDLSRDSDSAYVSEFVTVNPDGTSSTVPTFHAPAAGYTSDYTVGIGVDYMMRLTSGALAPYMGAGGGISFGQTAEKWTNDTNPLLVLERDHMKRTFGVGLEGILGVEWRVHSAIALFAEYKLGIDVLSRTSHENTDTSISSTLGTTTETDSGSHTEFLNWQTELGQQGMLGLVAFF